MQKRIRESHVYGLSEADRTALLAKTDAEFRAELKKRGIFSELPEFIARNQRLPVPVYTIWGQQEGMGRWCQTSDRWCIWLW